MSDKHMKDALENLARRGVPEDINLWPHISARFERNSLTMTFRTRPLLAIFIALLALLILSSVAYAIGKLTGFIPGVGIVDQSTSLRILAEPVIVKRDGLTVTVSQVVADSTHTFVAYTVDGIIVPKMARPICGAIPLLQLPDGSALKSVNLDDGGAQGARVGSIMKLEQSVTYSSIPVGVDTVTFSFPCILPEGTGPENWQIPLKLSPAPKEYVTPAVEVGATFVASNPTFGITPSSPATSGPTLNRSGLHLEKVIELPDSYILVGNFTDAGDLPGPLEINLDPYGDLTHMEDGSGKPVMFKVREDIQPENPLGGVRYWAYEVAKPIQGPLTITLDQINIAVSDTTQFTFDAGPNPQVGQKWELNLPIHLRKYDYVVDSVEVIKDGYLFKYHSDLDIPVGVILSINIIGYSPEQDNSGGVRQETVMQYSKDLVYAAPLPKGQLTVELSLSESVPLRDPWTLTWTPPSK